MKFANLRRRSRLTRQAVLAAVVVSMPLACTQDGGTGEGSRAARAAPKLILIIGDGMDDQQITIARNYLVGADGRLTLDRMPFRGAVQVQGVDEADPSRPVYVSDSANTATSMATGELTSPARIGTSAGADADLVTVMELAQAAGLATGIVTTASVTDATPASFVAHVNQRLCQGPRDMLRRFEAFDLDVDCTQDYKSAGGRGSIAEQIADSALDVVLGGGTAHFDQPAEGEATATVADLAAANGFRVLRDAQELASINGTGRVLGLFSRDTMPVQWRGENDARAVELERVDDRVQLPEPFGCEFNPQFEGMPRLAQMTRAALDQFGENRGFVLMIESASIDKQSHVRRPCGHIGELAQLDEALTLVLDYVRQSPETLVLVTADHSHAAQIVDEDGGAFAPRYGSPGHLARVRTPEGSVMGINYATNDSPTQEYHTGAQVPLYAAGGNATALPPFIAQRELFGIMTRHLDLD